MVELDNRGTGREGRGSFLAGFWMVGKKSFREEKTLTPIRGQAVFMAGMQADLKNHLGSHRIDSRRNPLQVQAL